MGIVKAKMWDAFKDVKGAMKPPGAAGAAAVEDLN